MRKSLCVAMLFLAVFALSWCALTEAASVTGEVKDNALYVGVTPSTPPLIFKTNDRIEGLEADLARRVGKEFGRPIRFVELPWDQQIGALLDRRIDIIMSSMTITEARKVRINFTEPYLKSGLLATVRAGDSAKYASMKSIVADFPSVGVIAGTTGEAYVRQNMPKSPRVVRLQKVSDAAAELLTRRIDVFIHDAPAVVWLVSENEANLRLVRELLQEEYLGWGVRREDQELTLRINALLGRWKQDGSLREMILRWLPYWKQFE